MTTLKRIQRKRGWKMPPGAVYVGRPGPLGNPFIVGKQAPDVLDLIYEGVTIKNCPPHLDLNDYLTYGIRGNVIPDADTAVRLYRQYIETLNLLPGCKFYENLCGYDLACWCKPGAPCHADVLLEIANA